MNTWERKKYDTGNTLGRTGQTTSVETSSSSSTSDSNPPSTLSTSALSALEKRSVQGVKTSTGPSERPRLKLLKRGSSDASTMNNSEPKRNASIFGAAKPREEPPTQELNKTGVKPAALTNKTGVKPAALTTSNVSTVEKVQPKAILQKPKGTKSSNPPSTSNSTSKPQQQQPHDGFTTVNSRGKRANKKKTKTRNEDGEGKGGNKNNSGVARNTGAKNGNTQRKNDGRNTQRTNPSQRNNSSNPSQQTNTKGKGRVKFHRRKSGDNSDKQKNKKFSNKKDFGKSNTRGNTRNKSATTDSPDAFKTVPVGNVSKRGGKNKKTNNKTKSGGAGGVSKDVQSKDKPAGGNVEFMGYNM